MRFWDPKENTFDIDGVLAMNVVPGPPATWHLVAIADEDGGSVEVSEDGTWSVACGQAFTLALEPSDMFGNRCGFAVGRLSQAVHCSGGSNSGN